MANLTVSAAVDTFMQASTASAARTALELSDETAKLGVHGADIASAGTTNLETATGELVDVTGTTAITAVTLNDGHRRIVRFTGILTLTNGASLVLPGAANITTAAGDIAMLQGYAAGVVRCVSYMRAAVAPFNPAAPGAIGGTTPATGAFTTLSGTGTLAVTGATTLTGNLISTPEHLIDTAGVMAAISVTKLTTILEPTQLSTTSLISGTADGQLKLISTLGNFQTVVTVNIELTFTTLTFTNTGGAAVLQWDATAATWNILSLALGCTYP